MFQLFYHCKQAQVKADDRKRRLQNYHNLTIELRKFIREKVTREQGSPAQIVGHLQKKGERCVCIETIYAYIRADRAAGEDLWKHCRHQLKHRKRQATQPYNAVKNRTMIDERPPERNGSTPGTLRWTPLLANMGKVQSLHWQSAIHPLLWHENCLKAKCQGSRRNGDFDVIAIYRQDPIHNHRQRQRVCRAYAHC